jgi:hypothetical protein
MRGDQRTRPSRSPKWSAKPSRLTTGCQKRQQEPTMTPQSRQSSCGELHPPEPVSETPPFEPDLFTPLSGSERRRYHRLKCYVAVEIRIEGQEAPVWGNLANVSHGGCLVETASAVPAGKILEIGLWLASGKIWVKGRDHQRSGHTQRALVWRAGKILPGGTIGKRTPAGILDVRPEQRPQVAKPKRLCRAIKELSRYYGLGHASHPVMQGMPFQACRRRFP